MLNFKISGQNNFVVLSLGKNQGFSGSIFIKKSNKNKKKFKKFLKKNLSETVSRTKQL